jgi:hypothetical protein
MRRVFQNTEAALTIAKGRRGKILNFAEQGDHFRRLPKHVRLLGGTARGAARTPSDMYEFEVVTGNAAYAEGERFYLTPAQAERAYFSRPPYSR